MTEQQELYVKGFEEALEDIKAKEQHQHKNDEGHYLNHHHPIFHHEHQTLLTSPSDAILTIEKATAAYNRLKHVQQKSQANTQQPVATLPPPPPPLILAPFSSVGDMSRPSSGASGSLDSSIESHYLNSNVIKFSKFLLSIIFGRASQVKPILIPKKQNVLDNC